MSDDLQYDRHNARSEAAEAYVRTVFASGWILRSRPRDIGTDYDIERVESNIPTGRFVWIQQKAPEKVKSLNRMIQYSVENKHLRYWAKMDRPVFLLIVDVAGLTGYWTFIQEWIDRSGKAVCPTKGRTVVNVPETQRLSDLPLFLSAFNKSIAYMREKFPGSVEAAARNEVERLERLDARCAVGVYFDGGKKSYSIKPKAPLSFSLVPKQPFGAKLEDFERYGKALIVNSDEASFTDLPIIRQLLDEGFSAILTVKSSESKPCSMDFSVEHEGQTLVLQVIGEMTRGQRGLHFSGKDNFAIINAEFTISLESGNEGMLRISFDLGRWEQRPVLSLPLFETLHSFCDAVRAGAVISHRLIIEGRVAKGKLTRISENNVFANSVETLSIIHKGRELAKAFHINPALPSLASLKDEDISTILIGYDIFVRGGYTITTSAARIRCQVDAPLEQISRLLNDRPGAEAIMLVPNGKIRIFGEECFHCPIEKKLDPAIMVASPEGIAARKAGTVDHLLCEFVSDGAATYSVRPLEPSQYPSEWKAVERLPE